MGAAAHATPDANKTFRECNDARELLLDYYVRRRFVPPEVVESIEDNPDMDESLFSIWTSTRSFQIEAFFRLSICAGLAVATYYHDMNSVQRRKEQVHRRDAQFYQFGPNPRF